ncbi:hypothetical protein QZH41_007398 [Actinostola sp. cb2023]|nr:hypothetical protein QZH41_007398 [Actinostola sp. cb2023]
MASMNIKAMSENTFKRAEREVGVMIEETSKESCEKWRKKEKRRGKGVGMKASYDAGWQKQGRAHNSRTGQGTMVGLQTGKCLDYGTKNAYCRKCFEAEKRGADPKPHDCRLNHVGSAKAMESSIAIEICQKDQYQVLIGDDDSTVISRPVRAEVNSNLEKWSDINHATCTLTKALYEGRGRNFGPDNDRLNGHVIDHVKTCFTYALHQNKNNISGIVEGIKAIVPHSFGDHTNCGQWCRQRKDPEAYRHSTLQSGRDLRGDGLKHFLNDVLQPFTREEVVKKLSPLGSTQRNECINGIVGTKNPKKRFYGGSESSDYRVSAAVAQFNEGYQYLKTVEEKMGCAEEETMNAYITRMQRERKQCTERKQKRSSKRRRKELKGKKKKQTKEMREKRRDNVQFRGEEIRGEEIRGEERRGEREEIRGEREERRLEERRLEERRGEERRLEERRGGEERERGEERRGERGERRGEERRGEERRGEERRGEERRGEERRGERRGEERRGEERRGEERRGERERRGEERRGEERRGEERRGEERRGEERRGEERRGEERRGEERRGEERRGEERRGEERRGEERRGEERRGEERRGERGEERRGEERRGEERRGEERRGEERRGEERRGEERIYRC